MSESVLEAIKKGYWDYEPPEVSEKKFDCTEAMPGSQNKLSVLAERIEKGLPLWHPSDRLQYNETDEE